MSTIFLKKKEEIALMQKACDILSRTLGLVVHKAKPGISLLELDRIAEKYILENGGLPTCKGYCGFPNTLCLSVNEKVVHGIPNKYILKDGDIVTVDSCVTYDGFCSDCAYTFAIGEINDNIKKMLEVTKDSLYKGIKECVVGNTIGDIGHAIEKNVIKNGFFVVKEYSGHGIGREMHELPYVFNYGKKGDGVPIKNGMVLAIEPIVGETTGKTKVLNNGTDIVMSDGCLSAHYEHTVAVVDDKPKILTTFKYCEN